MKITDAAFSEIEALLPLAEFAKYAPTLIVAVERGGLIPAAISGAKLGLPICSIRAKLYDDSKPAKKIYRSVAVDLRGADFSGKRLLIIDDISNSGETLSEVKKALLLSGASEAKTFALFGNSDFSSRPFGGCVKFPWEH